MSDEDLIVRGPRHPQPSSTSLGEYYLTRLEQHGDLEAQVQEVEGGLEVRTYSDLLIQGKRVAAFLREQGLDSGDTVMICCGNTLEFTPIMLGTLFVGATMAPINYQYEASEMVHHLNAVAPSLIICNPAAEAALTEAIDHINSTVTLVTMATMVQVLGDPSRDLPDFRLGQVPDPASHVAFVLCSSGTSGRAKGIELTHEAIYLMKDFHLYWFSELPLEHREVALNMSGPYWVTVQMAQFIIISRGVKQVILKEFSEKGFFHTVEKFKVNYAMLGPGQVAALAKWPDVELYNTTSLRSIGFGGAPTCRAMYELAQKRIGTKMSQVYGLTECLGVAKPAYEVIGKTGTSGTLHTNVDAKVIDVSTGRLLGRGQEGELCFRNPSAMKGYRNNPAATRAMVDAEGFLHTGDVGYFDQDGFLYIRDRVKELIKYKEIQVNVMDIEEVLLSHSEVQDVAIVGIFHEADLERATGFVVRSPGGDVSARDLEELVEAKLPKFDWLHGGVRFVDFIPKTATGKVKKRTLREWAR